MITPLQNTFCKTVKQARRKCKPMIRQKDMAVLLGISHGGYRKIETGKQKMFFEHAMKICSILGLSIIVIDGRMVLRKSNLNVAR